MRLRLQVLRQGLPVVKIVWIAKPDDTVSQLLEQVDNVLPLEAEGWGLEDYSIAIDDYEMLHWMRLGDVCNEDDQICIRPLQTNDLRERRITGRRQITADGRHLVDGVAFGRHCLRNPIRPEIRIPPRKRIRLNEEDADDESSDADEDGDLGMLGDHVVEPRDDDEENSLEFSDPEECERMAIELSERDAKKILKETKAVYTSATATEDEKDQARTLHDLIIQARNRSPATKNTKTKRVSFNDPREQHHMDQDEDDDDDDEDDDFEPPSGDDNDDEDEDIEESDYEIKAIEAGNASDSSWNGISSGANTPTTALDATLGGKARSDSASSSDSHSSSENSSDDTSDSDEESEDDSSNDGDSTSDSSSDDDSDAPSEEPINKQPAGTGSAPNQGKIVTKKRNQRRRDGKKLKFLQSKGILPKTATRADLLEWQKLNPGPDDAKTDQDVSDQASHSHLSQHPNGDISSDEAEDLSLPELSYQQEKRTSKKAQSKSDHTETLNRQREALLARLRNGGVDVQDSLDSPVPENYVTNDEMNDATTDGASDSPVSEPARRKLDLAASQRLLYGSLGVRRPKNDSEKQELRSKLAAQSQRKSAKQQSTQTDAEAVIAPEPEHDDPDPELWKRRINLSAVECVTEGVEYIKPPFPFRQRWDPQMREKKRKRASQAYTAPKKGRKHNHDEIYNNNGYSEHYDTNAGDALDYDDEGDGDGDEDGYWDEVEYFENGAQADGDEASAQLLQETTGAHTSTLSAPTGDNKSSSTEQGDDSDLPPLPTDLDALPMLTKGLAIPGAIITFSRFEVSAATNWAPGMSPMRVALVTAVDGEADVLELRLAKRDVPRKQYDAQGRRLLSGFEMDLGEEEDEGVVQLSLAEIIGGRVVREAPAASAAIESTIDPPGADALVQDKEVSVVDVAPETEAVVDVHMQETETATADGNAVIVQATETEIVEA